LTDTAHGSREPLLTDVSTGIVPILLLIAPCNGKTACFCVHDRFFLLQSSDSCVFDQTQPLRLKGGAAQTAAKDTIRQLMEAEKLSESAIRVRIPKKNTGLQINKNQA
jgi:hypothetical protein